MPVFYRFAARWVDQVERHELVPGASENAIAGPQGGELDPFMPEGWKHNAARGDSLCGGRRWPGFRDRHYWP